MGGRSIDLDAGRAGQTFPRSGALATRGGPPKGSLRRAEHVWLSLPGRGACGWKTGAKGGRCAAIVVGGGGGRHRRICCFRGARPGGRGGWGPGPMRRPAQWGGGIRRVPSAPPPPGLRSPSVTKGGRVQPTVMGAPTGGPLWSLSRALCPASEGSWLRPFVSVCVFPPGRCGCLRYMCWGAPRPPAGTPSPSPLKAFQPRLLEGEGGESQPEKRSPLTPPFVNANGNVLYHSCCGAASASAPWLRRACVR